MQNFKNKYQYKDYIADLVSELDISKDTFEKMFAHLFLDLFEKEQLYACFFTYLKISLVNRIADEIKKIKKKDKTIFLPLFEDYLKLNKETDDIVIQIKKKCMDSSGKCKNGNDCVIDISKYPTLLRLSEHGELESFKPDLITSQQFIDFFKENIGKFGLYFLYNLNKELLILGQSTNLGESVIDLIWKKNIDGYVAVAYTNTKADMYLYETYYVLKEKPLLTTKYPDLDEVSVSLKPLKRTELVKIYTNN
jgi:hypothetical protein